MVLRGQLERADDTPNCPRPCPGPSDRLLKPSSPALTDTQAAGGMSSPPWAGAPCLLQTVRGAHGCPMEIGFSMWVQELLAPRGDAVLTSPGEARPLQPGERGDQAPPGPCGEWGEGGAESAESACGGACPHVPCLTRPPSVPCPGFVSVPGGFSGPLASLAPSLALCLRPGGHPGTRGGVVPWAPVS